MLVMESGRSGAPRRRPERKTPRHQDLGGRQRGTESRGKKKDEAGKVEARDGISRCGRRWQVQKLAAKSVFRLVLIRPRHSEALRRTSEYTRGIRHLVDIGAFAEKEVIQ